MSIDTAAKRNSAMLDPGNLPWPPDGTIATDDRLVMLEFYSGIAAEAPTQPTGRWEYTVERSLWELTVSKVDDYTADDLSDYTMEVP